MVVASYQQDVRVHKKVCVCQSQFEYRWLALVYKRYLAQRALHAYEHVHAFVRAWWRLSLKVSVLLLGWCHSVCLGPLSICGQKDAQTQMI